MCLGRRAISSPQRKHALTLLEDALLSTGQVKNASRTSASGFVPSFGPKSTASDQKPSGIGETCLMISSQMPRGEVPITMNGYMLSKVPTVA